MAGVDQTYWCRARSNGSRVWLVLARPTDARLGQMVPNTSKVKMVSTIGLPTLKNLSKLSFSMIGWLCKQVKKWPGSSGSKHLEVKMVSRIRFPTKENPYIASFSSAGQFYKKVKKWAGSSSRSKRCLESDSPDRKTLHSKFQFNWTIL